MFVRVTEGSASYGALAGLQAASARLASAQAKLSSGKQITTSSDNPSGTVRAMQLRADLKRNSQYASSATDALSWMGVADTSYTQMVSLTQQARTLVVQALNTGASTGTSASAIADQLDSIRSSLIDLANTTYNGRPVFGGTTNKTTAYTDAGVYQGDNGIVSRTVGPKTTIAINQTGPQIFTDPGTGQDLFGLLQTISDTLHTDPASPTLSTDLTSLDGAVKQISNAQAAEGAAYQRVQASQNAQQATQTTLKSNLSDIQDIDIADMAVQVTTANTVYQAALQTTASIRQMSLLDYLH